MPLEAGRRLGPYEIAAPIGAGGMGEVYRAHDARLSRDVALKILPTEMASGLDRLRRFTREARAAAALNHPHIAQIHDVGESNGIHFIAMELVDGTTLRETIHRDRPELTTMLSYLAQVADGLAAAHRAGIVHRDLKPDNILIARDGYAKILDFGLAKLLEPEHPAGLGGLDGCQTATALPPSCSEPGLVLGTAGYMSPEQAQGLAVDERSDIFSFGCVLYEAATRHRPFDGDSIVDTLHRIIYAPVRPIPELNASAPAELWRIVRKCLAKNPDQRYQYIKDVGVDLKELQRELERDAASPLVVSAAPIDVTTATGPRSVRVSRSISSAEYIVRGLSHYKRSVVIALALIVVAAASFAAYSVVTKEDSVAVLPFTYINADPAAMMAPDADYLSDGITESIIDGLSQISNVKVIARSSVFRYRGKDVDPQIVGRQLGVRKVLMGRIHQRGDGLSISVELVDTADSTHVWGQQFEKKLANLAAVPREIANDVSENLRVRWRTGKVSLKPATVNPEAYRLYLRGRYYWNKRTEEGLTKAIEFFEQATRADPQYALAYSGAADSYSSLSDWGYQRPNEVMPKAKAAALKALETDNALAEGHTSLARFTFDYDWDWAGAEREYRRAIELNPHYALGHQWYAEFLSKTGQHEAAIAEMARALEADPLSLVSNRSMGMILFKARRLDQAIEQLRRTIELDRNFAPAYFTLGDVYSQKGMHAEAVTQHLKAREVRGDSPADIAAMREAYAASGWRGYCQKRIDLAIERSKHGYVAPGSFALIYAALGDQDQVLIWLESAFEERSSSMTWLKDPWFDGLRGNPRFEDLVRRVGLPE